MVADIQGVFKPDSEIVYNPQRRRIHITDPQMLSRDRRYGSADLGAEAIERFKLLHKCNGFCHKLRLPPCSGRQKVPRTRNMASGRKSPSRQSNPPAPPANVQQANRPARGRSPVQASRSHVEEEKRQEERVSIQDLLFNQHAQSAKKLLFV
eukprot:2227576-Amphidinium_carterae.1